MTEIEYDTTPWGKFRDALAWRIANFAMNRLATPWYRAMITGAINLGIDEAVERSKK